MTSRPSCLRHSMFSCQTSAPTQSYTTSHPLPVGEFFHPLADAVDLAVVDDLVGAPFLRLFQLPVAAGGGDHPATHHLGDLDAHAAHAGAGGLDPARRSQGCSFAWVMRQCQEVCRAMGNAEASAKDILIRDGVRVDGRRDHILGGVPPSRSTPMRCCRAHHWSCPAEQCSHKLCPPHLTRLSIRIRSPI